MINIALTDDETPTTNSLAAGNSFVDLGIALDDAVKGGYVSETSLSTTQAALQSKARTAYRYLFLLGYLDKLPPNDLSVDGKKSADLKVKIKEAIQNFQTDCSISISGKLNAEVWGSLLQLASFDSPINIKQWFSNGKPLPVLIRATQVRLYAFNLSNRLPRTTIGNRSKDKEQKTNLERGLNDFVLAVNLLNISDQSLEPRLTYKTLRVLFNQDEIVRRLALRDNTTQATDTSNTYMSQDGISAAVPIKKNLKLDVKFVRNIARVELWLFGYNVLIGSGRDKDRIQQGSGKQSLDAALNDFLDVHVNDSELTNIEKGAITGLFFKRLSELRLQSEDPDNAEDADVIVNEVLEDKNVASQVRQGIKSFGSRLWDGAKRVWRWFKSGIKKIFNKAKRIVKAVISNITRYVHTAAANVFARVKAVVRAVKDGLNFLKEKVIRGSDPRHMVITHDKDFDFYVFIHKDADPDVVRNLSERLNVRTKIFLTASKIISELLSLFAGMIRRGITTGWFGLLLALGHL